MCSGNITALISLNHTAQQGGAHALSIPMADIMAGVEKCYDATGASTTHKHYVTLTAADFATLRSGGVVRKFTCNGGDHEYVLSCAANPPTPGTPSQCTATSEQGMMCP
jgi:hypothetical protein